MSVKVTVEFTDEEWEQVRAEALLKLIEAWITSEDAKKSIPRPTLDGVSPPNILRLVVGEQPRKHGGKREKLTDRSVS